MNPNTSLLEINKRNEEEITVSPQKAISTTEKQTLNSVLQPNLPEKIVLCIDVSEEMSKRFFNLKDQQSGESFRVHLIKALTIFLRTKVTFNVNHQFAILFYADTAFWISAFTRDVDRLLELINNIPTLQINNNFHISIIFNSLLTNVHLSNSPSKHIYRSILFYARHHCIPVFDVTQYKAFQECDHFIMDVVYLCNPETTDNRCQDILESFCGLDLNDTSYIIAASDESELMLGMAQMLAHPLQRPLQKDVSLTLNTLIHSGL